MDNDDQQIGQILNRREVLALFGAGATVLNNTVLGLFARHGQPNVPTAQRTFSYHLARALACGSRT